MAEQVFFQEGNVLVTKTRVAIGSQMYPLSNLTSIHAVAVPPKRNAELVLGLLAVVSAMGMLAKELAGFCGFTAFVLVVAAVLIGRSQKTTYHLMVTTAGMDRPILSSPDEQFITRASGAITEAIIARG